MTRANADDGSLAAVDLGSNSFHMVIGRVIGGQISLIDRLREPVRLAAGLRPDGTLEPDTTARALACLERFSERLRDVPSDRKRVVGTNTLRRASKAGSFLSDARHALGMPVEIIPGAEEARLIYLGVAHGVESNERTRLVMDIGGGSTELILGRGFEPQRVNSLHMGCVSWTRRFFDDGRITRDGWRKAVLAARQELEPIESAYREQGWDDAVGASGTVRAVRTILQESGWSDGLITQEGLKSLRRAFLEAGTIEALDLAGLSEDRRPVIVGGAAIVKALFDAFDFDLVRTSDYALREGILYDLHGRIEHQDVRERTVENLALRYHVDIEQAARVELTALDLFREVASDWDLDRSRGTRYLRWAARLIEVGLAIAYTGYHKHGAYVVANSTMPGFARESRALLAALVRSHRRKIDVDLFAELPPYYRELALKLCVLLRLSVCLNRGRGATALPTIHAKAESDGLRLELPSGWLEDHPLTSADLAAESAVLATAGVQFSAT